MKMCYGAQSDLGRKREVNQDCYGITESLDLDQSGRLLIVCDGMGGHMAGEVASRLGVHVFLAHYYTTEQADRRARLTSALAAANEQIYERGRGTMGTTSVVALLLGEQLHIANVGDSRAYLLRNGQIQQLSQDHSFVAEQVAAGLLTPEQARVSAHRNMITRALGHQANVQIDLFPPIALQPGDSVILSTDGMHGLIEDNEIAGIVSTLLPEEAVQHLVALANERGGTDNITVLVAQILPSEEALDAPAARSGPITQPLPEMPTPPAPSATHERRLTRRGLLLALATLLLLVTVGVVAAWFPASRSAGESPPGLVASTTVTATPTRVFPTQTPTSSGTVSPTAAPTRTPGRTPTRTGTSGNSALAPPEPTSRSESPRVGSRLQYI